MKKPSGSLKLGAGNGEISALISSLSKNFCLDINFVHKMFIFCTQVCGCPKTVLSKLKKKLAFTIGLK